jgi:hypothetical protein
LLGELHVGLLKSVIKDIEDVARTPSVALGVNQSSANSGGGHPQIVEGVCVQISGFSKIYFLLFSGLVIYIF